MSSKAASESPKESHPTPPVVLCCEGRTEQESQRTPPNQIGTTDSKISPMVPPLRHQQRSLQLHPSCQEKNEAGTRDQHVGKRLSCDAEAERGFDLLSTILDGMNVPKNEFLLASPGDVQLARRPTYVSNGLLHVRQAPVLETPDADVDSNSAAVATPERPATVSRGSSVSYISNNVFLPINVNDDDENNEDDDEEDHDNFNGNQTRTAIHRPPLSGSRNLDKSVLDLKTLRLSSDGEFRLKPQRLPGRETESRPWEPPTLPDD